MCQFRGFGLSLYDYLLTLKGGRPWMSDVFPLSGILGLYSISLSYVLTFFLFLPRLPPCDTGICHYA